MFNCPPVCEPSINSGFKSALAAYMAAVSPAGPEPIIITLRMSLLMLLLTHYYLLIAFHSLLIASYSHCFLFNVRAFPFPFHSYRARHDAQASSRCSHLQTGYSHEQPPYSSP